MRSESQVSKGLRNNPSNIGQIHGMNSQNDVMRCHEDAKRTQAVPRVTVRRLEITRSLERPLPREMKLVVASMNSSNRPFAVTALSNRLERQFDQESINRFTEKLIAQWDVVPSIECRLTQHETFTPGAQAEQDNLKILDIVVGFVNNELRTFEETLPVLPVGWASLDLERMIQEEEGMLIDIKIQRDLDRFPIFRIANSNFRRGNGTQTLYPSRNNDVDFFNYHGEACSRTLDQSVLKYFGIQSSLICLSYETETNSTGKKIVRDGIHDQNFSCSRVRQANQFLSPSNATPFSSFKRGSYARISSRQRGTKSPSSLSLSRKPSTVTVVPDDMETALSSHRSDGKSQVAKSVGDTSWENEQLTSSWNFRLKGNVFTRLGKLMKVLWSEKGTTPLKRNLPFLMFGNKSEDSATVESSLNFSLMPSINKESLTQQKPPTKMKIITDSHAISYDHTAREVDSIALQDANMLDIFYSDGVEADELYEEKRVLDDSFMMSLESQNIIPTSSGVPHLVSGRSFEQDIDRGEAFVEDSNANLIDEAGSLHSNSILPTCFFREGFCLSNIAGTTTLNDGLGLSEEVCKSKIIRASNSVITRSQIPPLS